MKTTIALGLMAAVSLSACDNTATASNDANLPAMRWDHRPEAATWTVAALNALQKDTAGLPEFVPADISTYCPGYPEADTEDRAAFWAGLLSALAEHESTWNPDAVGGGGKWFGLVQIAPGTAQGYGCAARTGDALKDGASNLRCAVRIATAQVTERGSVSDGMLDWGPFHSDGKRAEMQDWTREQPYCQTL